MGIIREAKYGFPTVTTPFVCPDERGRAEELASPFEGRDESMTREGRGQRLKEFGNAPDDLTTTLRRIPKRMWLFRPEPDRWSIHEIVLHLCDSEVHGYMTCRRLIAEPGQDVLEYDANRWTDSLGYLHQSTKEAIDILRRLRRMTYWLLTTARPDVWSNKVKHARRGELSLDQWLDQQVRHLKRHIKQIEKNYEFWQSVHPSRKPPSTRAQKRGPSARRVYKTA